MLRIQAKKLKMSQIFKNEEQIPVSILKVKIRENLENIKEGDLIAVEGTTKGHGFQGPVKRYSFAGGPKSHGQKNRLRAPGSIGSTAPQRVIPGLKMAGHMGVAKKTIKNLKVVEINKEEGTVFLNGSVPGTNRSTVFIKIKNS